MPHFFAADQNVLLEHQFANVLEADGCFVEFPAEFAASLSIEFRDGKRSCDIPRQVAGSCRCHTSSAKMLVRIDERTVAVDGPDAVAISVRAEAGVVFSGTHSLAQVFDVRLNRLGMHAAETRVARPANLIAVNSVAAEELWQQPGC